MRASVVNPHFHCMCPEILFYRFQNSFVSIFESAEQIPCAKQCEYPAHSLIRLLWIAQNLLLDNR